MPSWNNPSNSNPSHVSLLQDLADKDTYAATLGQSSVGYTDLPEGTINWDNAQKLIRRLTSGDYAVQVISIAGGGTGAGTAAGARANLGVLKAGTTGAEARTNAQNDSRFVQGQAGTGGGEFRTNDENDSRFVLGNAGTGSSQFRTNSQNDSRFVQGQAGTGSSNFRTNSQNDGRFVLQSNEASVSEAKSGAAGKWVDADTTAVIYGELRELSRDRFSFKADFNGSSYSATNSCGDIILWGIQNITKIGAAGVLKVNFTQPQGTNYSVQATVVDSNPYIATISNINSSYFYVYIHDHNGNLADQDVFITINRNRTFFY